MTTTLKRINKRDFEKLASLTKLGDDARAMACAVLVDGKSMTEVAAEFGMTKQRVSLAVGSIRRMHESQPTGTATLQVELEMPERVYVALAGLLQAYGKSRSKAARDEALSLVEQRLATITALLSRT